MKNQTIKNFLILLLIMACNSVVTKSFGFNQALLEPNSTDLEKSMAQDCNSQDMAEKIIPKKRIPFSVIEEANPEDDSNPIDKDPANQDILNNDTNASAGRTKTEKETEKFDDVENLKNFWKDKEEFKTCEKTNLDDLKKKLDSLPCFKPCTDTDCYSPAAITIPEFVGTLLNFIEIMQTQLHDENLWLNKESAFSNQELIFNERRMHLERFYAQKLDLPKDSKVYIHGDIHGDCHSLMAYLSKLRTDGIIDKDFKINGNNYIAFLGDYTDRGIFGIEALYAVMRLKIANPKKVILQRGNHEDIKVNFDYGFLSFNKDFFLDPDVPIDGEIKQRYGFNKGQEYTPIRTISCVLKQIYMLMPVASFVCILPEKESALKKYSLLCHAGVEPRYNPNKLLAQPGEQVFQKIEYLNDWVDKKTKYCLCDISNTLEELNHYIKTTDIGFLWNDHNLAKNVLFDKKGPRYGDEILLSNRTVKNYIAACKTEKYALENIFKGHEHSGKLFELAIECGGIFNICQDNKNQWNGKDPIELEGRQQPVWFLNVGPDSDYGRHKRYRFDTHCILSKKPGTEELLLEPVKIQVLNEHGELITDQTEKTK